MGLLESLRVKLAQSVLSPWQGMANDTWRRQLRLSKGQIDLSFAARAMLVSVSAPVNSWYRRRVDRVFGPQLRDAKILPPLFILGHWRSGTTHLQRLFALDQRFSWPNLFQCMYPGGFLISEERNRPVFETFLPKNRMFDAMGNSLRDAAEDEFALCNWCGLSSYLGWMFPHHWDYYNRYLTLKDVSDDELERWKQSLFAFARRLTVRYPGKPIIFKSPPHTARLKLLADLFPQAKFVHIHRDPHVVYSSTKRMHLTFQKSTQMQHDDPNQFEDRIINQYAAMHRQYFHDKPLIDEDRLIEIRFDELESSPLDTLRQIYQSLELPSFEEVEPAVVEYLQSVKDYKKNRYNPLPMPVQERIAAEWAPLIESWGYDLTPREAPAGTNTDEKK